MEVSMYEFHYSINDAEIDTFRNFGYLVVDSPIPPDNLEEIGRRHDEIFSRWAATEWPTHVHKMASQFCLMGEVAFELAEHPDFLSAGRAILGADEVFVGACAAGDTITAESVDGRPMKSLQWHCAPGRGGPTGPRFEQVAFRFPLDVHDESNGGLHLIPGTHEIPKREAEETIRREVSKAPDFREWEGLFFGTHPEQMVLYPEPGQMIIWTPDLWHCTGANPERRARRSITWTYFSLGGRFRDVGTLEHVLGAEGLNGWEPPRRQLWGLS
jgi:hypothetical protein